jgi:thioredoxin reductase
LKTTNYDITIIGGGPVGLFAGALAGEMGAKCNILESRCQLGGIMMAAYPDKDIYNFPGIPVIRGRELIQDLVNRVKSFGVDIRQGEYVNQILDGGEGSFIIISNRNEYISHAIIITTGLKAHYSPLIDYIRIQDWDGTGVFDDWPSFEEIKNKSLVLLCGISDEIRLPDELSQAVSGITVIWDRNVLGDHQVELFSPDGIKIETFRDPWMIRMISGDLKPASVILVNDETGEMQIIKTDVVVGFYRGQSRQTLFSNWGIEMIGQNIKVDQKMQTNMSKVYAAGDIAWYPGKIKLLSAGIQEVKIAMKNILKELKRATVIHELKRREND